MPTQNAAKAIIHFGIENTAIGSYFLKFTFCVINKQMLGLNSHISFDEDNSKISNSQQKELVPTKITRLTDHASYHEEYLDEKAKSSINKASALGKKMKEMKKRFDEMQKKQEMDEQKFEFYVKALEKELEKKKKQNQELKEQINQIKKEIGEEEVDVQVISNFLSKKKVIGTSNAKIKDNEPIKIRPNRILHHSSKKLNPLPIRKSSDPRKSQNLDPWKLKSTN